MDTLHDYLSTLSAPEQRERMEEVFQWIASTFPNLESRIAWKQPMFTDHDTFIIGFSASKQHMAVAPEQAGIRQFTEEIEQAGYGCTKEIIRIKWNQPVNYALLERIIAFNIADKAACTTFWR